MRMRIPVIREEQGEQPHAKAYVIETDAPCKHCGIQHGYVTVDCQLAIWLHFATTQRVVRRIEGIVRPLRHLPSDVSYVLFTTLPDGSRDPDIPAGSHTVIAL